MKVKIAFVQMIPGKTIWERYETGQAACQKAKAMGADIALFPEMWSCGYYIPQDSNQLRALAITEQSDFVQGFSKTAEKLNMAIGITFLEQNEPKPLNSMILFDRKGNNVLHYSKVHICAFDLEKVLSSGSDFYVNTLNTENGDLKVGAMICFDREFPESARILMLKGADPSTNGAQFILLYSFRILFSSPKTKNKIADATAPIRYVTVKEANGFTLSGTDFAQI